METTKIEDSSENTAQKKEEVSDCSSPSSSCSNEKPQGACFNPNLTDRIREKLIQTGEMDRLVELVDIKLTECGWKTDIQNILTDEIKKRKDMKLEELYELVREKGKGMVPKEIQEEMQKRIQESYEQKLDIKAWDVVFKNGQSALDAVEAGCSQCEMEQCDHTVGYGGSPDENGETTLDALIMDGVTHNVGAVAALRRVKSAISVARKVLEHTEHSLLVGDQATQFAIKSGFKEENLSTEFSLDLWKKWQANNCQPNFWKNVLPDPKMSCGPYKLQSGSLNSHNLKSKFGLDNHDTIGMIVIDSKGKIAGGTSSNGAKFKIPGRVGDSPIPGSGAYVDQEVGGAAATGDGDVMMRFVPSYNTVENMRHGMSPTEAAKDSIKRIVAKYPTFSGAIVATTISGDYGAACHGMDKFPFSVINRKLGNVTVESVYCI